MMRSLYSGVSGLQNHQIRMDVIGNNISNVNTIGFKKGRVNFQDMISQNMSTASKPTDELGGTNPKQVGLGMSVASIDTIFTQGSLQTTGNTPDVAIQGNGFFVLKEGDKTFYTRAGAFGVDAGGNLVNPATGMKVMGWKAVQTAQGPVINTSATVESLRIPVGSKDPAKATTRIKFASNLDKRTGIIPPNPTPDQVTKGTWVIDQKIVDSFGKPHTVRLEMTKVVDGNGAAVPNQWRATATVDPGTENRNTVTDVGATNSNTNQFIVTFDNLGAIQSVSDAEEGGDLANTGNLQVNLGYDVPDTTPDGGGNLLRQNVVLDLGDVGNYERALTQFAYPSTSKGISQDGYEMGYMENFGIDQKGIVTATYSNGTRKVLGEIALAGFVNPGGLEKSGNTVFSETQNSGEALVGAAGQAGRGKILSGILEMSNVDLSEQMVDMIVTQRGFQANSKTIQTSDTMLQEILTLKR